MVKSMNTRRTAQVAGAVCAMMLMAGCGQKPADEVVEYPVGETVKTEAEKTSVEDNSEYDSEDYGEAAGTLAYISEYQKEGTLSYNKELTIDGMKITYDLSYTIPEEVDRVPTYKVNVVSDNEALEADIVSALFGDTAVPMKDSNAFEYHYEEDYGDFLFAELQKRMSDNWWLEPEDVHYADLDTLSSWIDKTTYYSHIYEGEYNGNTCRLLIFYSEYAKRLYVSLYPKNIGEFIGDTSITQMGCSDISGSLLIGNWDNSRIIDLNGTMSDRSNKTDLSDKDISRTIYETFKDVPGMLIPEDQIDLYENIYEGKTFDIKGDSLPVKCECVFYTDKSMQSENFDGAVRNGYAVSVGNTVNGIPIYKPNTPDDIGDYSKEFKGGVVLIDNNGVFGFNLEYAFTIEDVIYDDTPLINIESAVTELNHFYDNVNMEDLYSNVDFIDIDLVYFPLKLDNDSEEDEYELIPTWVIRSQEERYIINAMDGSLIFDIN